MNLRCMLIPFACLLTTGLQSSCEGQDTDSSGRFHIVGAKMPLRLNGISSGVHLYIATSYWNGDIEHSYPSVILERAGRKRIIGNLNQLRGSVKVSSKEAALRYARLRTTPMTFDLFRPEEVEIIPFSGLARMPHYYSTESDWHFKPEHSGSLGVLSNRDYRMGRFTPPRIRQIAGGYVINRWTYTNGDNIGYVQEFVGNNGAYARRVLKKKQARLPHTQWQLPDASKEE